MGAIAGAAKLSRFDNIYLIGDFAERFGLDPDEVWWKSSFGTVIKFTCAYKERGEYSERFTDIWEQMT